MGDFNPAFATCPFGGLGLATGAGWLLPPLYLAPAERHWAPHGPRAPGSSKAKTSPRRNPWTN